MLKSAKNLIINTGNVVTWNRIKTVNAQKPEQELLRCLNLTLQYFKKNQTNADKDRLQSTESVEIHKEDYREKLNDEIRSGLQLTVKIFLSDYDPKTVKHAIDSLLQELAAHYIDSLVVAFPDSLPELESVKPVWQLLEAYTTENKVSTLGVSDFSKDSIEELYNWAQVKPSTDQVNLTTCCVMPQDLVEYAKENDIQLLTHHDSNCLLDDSALQQSLHTGMESDEDSSGWKVRWSLRYTAVIKSRSVIQNKGYLVAASR